jgi:hypothetical protein
LRVHLRSLMSAFNFSQTLFATTSRFDFLFSH